MSWARLAHLITLSFWAAVAACSALAVMPAAQAPQVLPSDKAEHFLAFVVLTALGVIAYPRRPLWLIGAGLSAFGALIELTQALPIVHRDCDVWDWVADTAAILSVMAARTTMSLRIRLSRLS